MFQINEITSNPLQSRSVVLADGTIVELEMYFRPMQQSWWINSLAYLGFEVRGLRICISPNLLYQWRNILPFGLACFSTGNRDPSLQQDFLSGQSKLYILTEAEVEEYTEYLEGG